MTVLRRQFHEKIKGSLMNDEDWWYLARDTESGRVFVIHEWSHVGVGADEEIDAGGKDIELAAFLNHHGPAQKKLLELVGSLVEEQSDA